MQSELPLAATPRMARPANDPGPTPTAVKVRRLQGRAWTDISAELFEVQAAGRGLVELPFDKTRLLIVLNEVGGHAELRIDPTLAARPDYAAANPISLLPEGVRAWHRFERTGYCRYLLIRFDVDRLLAGKAGRPQLQPRLMFSDATIWRHAQLIAEECERPGEPADSYGENLSLALFLALLRMNGGGVRENYRSRLAPWQLNLVTEFVRTHLAETLQLSQLAAISRLSTSHFGRAFKGSTGLPPHRWHLNMRIEEARAMLADVNASLADVACATGFADQSHFTRVFTKIVGVSPGAWRRAQSA